MKHPWILVVVLGMAMAVRAEEELFTNVYVVPPTFLSVEAGSPRPPAKELLEKVGISFPKGASAIYNATTSQLIVRNTEKQMELVEAYVEQLRAQIERQIFVAIFELTFQGDLAGLLEKQPQEPVFENSTLDDTIRSLFQFPKAATKRGEEEDPVYFGSREWLELEMTRMQQSAAEIEGGRAVRMAGSFTDDEAQVILRRLTRLPGVEKRVPPSLTMLSGQAAMTRLGEGRYGVATVLGAKEGEIDLELFLPERGKALAREGATRLPPTVRATIPSGNMAVVAEKKNDGNNRLIFVRTMIVDAAGNPFERTPNKPASREPEKRGEPIPLAPAQMEAVKKADQLAEEGSNFLANGQFAEAFQILSESLGLLPKHDMTEPRRKAYEKHLLRARDGMAKRKANAGTVLVAEGETLEQIAARLGVKEQALREANRLGHSTVKPGQLILVPPGARSESRTAVVLKELVLPEIDFKEVSLVHALAMLQEEILRLHDSDLFPEATPVFVLDVPENTRKTNLTLRLSNVPAHEALRYVVSLASCRYEVDGREVRILPVK